MNVQYVPERPGDEAEGQLTEHEEELDNDATEDSLLLEGGILE